MNQAFQHLPGHWPPAPSPSELDGQRVVVWGIGKHGGGIAAARHGARHGAKVAFLDRDQPSDELRRQIKAEGWAIYQGDLSHPDIADADWVVISPAIPLAILRRQPPIQASFISAEGLFASAHQGQRVVITGTKGKSTTAHILGTLLDWPVAGNSNEPLLDILQRCGAQQPVVCELSSFQLRYLTHQGFACNAAALTTLDVDHLDWHLNLGEYHQAKLQLFDWAEYVALGNVTEFAVSAAKKSKAQAIPAYAAEVADVLGQSPCPLIGKHNQGNAQLALRLARHIGISTEALAQRLSLVQALPHRLQLVHQRGDIGFINDSIATNPLACLAAIDAFDTPLALILGGSDKGADYNQLIRQIAERVAFTAVHLIGTTGPQLQELLQRQRIEAPYHPSLAEAVVAAYAELSQQDGPGYVLLSPACASFGLFEDFAARGQAFTALARSLD